MDSVHFFIDLQTGITTSVAVDTPTMQLVKSLWKNELVRLKIPLNL